MTKALLFGAIGTLAETSDLQREAFNAAFAEAGLDWHWSDPAYREMLERPGGRARIAGYAAARGETVDAARLHRRKTAIFGDRLIREGVEARPGVTETIAMARAEGLRLGFVTTTDYRNVEALLTGLGDQVTRAHFDFIGDRSLVGTGKPDPEIYALALDRLGVAATDAIAIEDSPPGAEAARRAGIPVIAFPGLMHRDRPFPDAVLTTTRLDYSRLRQIGKAA